MEHCNHQHRGKERTFSLRMGEWNENAYSFAANHGHLECLRYAHENGYAWDDQGHLNCLKYAERMPINNSM